MTKKRHVLIRPLFTEKMTGLGEDQRKYGFEVRPDANKIEIARAVKGKFNVDVIKVATMNMNGKAKSMTTRSGGKVIRTAGRRKNWKKAIVTLEEGQAIDLYQGEGVSL